MKSTLNFLHHQAGDWKRELNFFKDESSVLTKRLEESAAKNTAKDLLAHVEHFQNKFILFRDQVDQLKHAVYMRERLVENMAKERPEHIGEIITTPEDEILKQMKDLHHSFADTRYEFNSFLANIL